jgi:hypothetical protein
MSVPIFIFPIPRFQTLFPVSECSGAYRFFSNTIYCHGRALGLVCYSVSNIARPLNLCAEAVILRQWKNTWVDIGRLVREMWQQTACSPLAASGSNFCARDTFIRRTDTLRKCDAHQTTQLYRSCVCLWFEVEYVSGSERDELVVVVRSWRHWHCVGWDKWKAWFTKSWSLLKRF